MEVFFLKFQKIFPGPARPPEGGGKQSEKGADFVGQPQKKGQNQFAEGEKVEPASQRHRGNVEDAHLSVAAQQGESEQGRRRPQPEQQVQQEGQRRHVPAPAQSAHPVVHQAQRRPQQEALPEDQRLARNIYVHGQRSSRDRKPPRLPPPSSS